MDKNIFCSNLFKLKRLLHEDKHQQFKEFIIKYFNEKNLLELDNNQNDNFELIWIYFIENLSNFYNNHIVLYKYIIDYAYENNIIIELNKIANEYLKTVSLLKIGEDKQNILDNLNILNKYANEHLLVKKNKRNIFNNIITLFKRK
jgi:hypothetical protein